MLDKLAQEIEYIKRRNQRVEADKAWETSKTRKLVIFVLTYVTVVILFVAANLPNPLTSALVPSLAFVLSTLSLPLFKRWWLRYSTNHHDMTQASAVNHERLLLYRPFMYFRKLQYESIVHY